MCYDNLKLLLSVVKSPILNSESVISESLMTDRTPFQSSSLLSNSRDQLLSDFLHLAFTLETYNNVYTTESIMNVGKKQTSEPLA